MAKEKVTMLTTVDNPFDPFDDFANWFAFDMLKGYNTCGMLSNFAETSDIYSDDENTFIIESAIDEIIEVDPLKIYKKIIKEVETD